jgi:hypothetical protein
MGGVAVLTRRGLSIKPLDFPGVPRRAAAAEEPIVDRRVFVVKEAAEFALGTPIETRHTEVRNEAGASTKRFVAGRPMSAKSRPNTSARNAAWLIEEKL